MNFYKKPKQLSKTYDIFKLTLIIIIIISSGTIINCDGIEMKIGVLMPFERWPQFSYSALTATRVALLKTQKDASFFPASQINVSIVAFDTGFNRLSTTSASYDSLQFAAVAAGVGELYSSDTEVAALIFSSKTVFFCFVFFFVFFFFFCFSFLSFSFILFYFLFLFLFLFLLLLNPFFFFFLLLYRQMS